ncbi:MAG: ABC transporter ATP-binding protein [Trueperaceae bacterium]|nr:ABC transporter ATP-binding protein [Trueperaceae bacterium]
MGDRIVVMLDGVIQQIASPLELYHRPVNKFVAGFIGSPPMNFLDGTIQAQNGSMRFVDNTGQVSLEVHSDHRDRLQPYAGKKVVLGIRPEAFVENRDQHVVAGRSVRANVEVVEPMGSEIYLYLDFGGRSVTARIGVEREPTVNEPHVLDVDMSRVHFFDAETERALVR